MFFLLVLVHNQYDERKVYADTSCLLQSVALLMRLMHQVLRRVWNYHWRLWAIPEAREMLLEAGFDAVHFWLRPMRQQGSAVAPEASSSQPKGKACNGRQGSRRGHGGNGRRKDASNDDSDGDYEQKACGVEEQPEEAEFREWVDASSFSDEEMLRINLGWTAYLVAVVNSRAGQAP